MNVNNAYINALLADSAYVGDLIPGMTGVALSNQLTGRMTSELAQFIGENFAVVNQIGGLASSFDATVWRGKAGTDYAGQVYVSMRGTQEAVDFVADSDLAASGLARQQLADMVNWWLRETTPAWTDAHAPKYVAQISVDPNSDFVMGTAVQGTGNLVGVGAIKSVNGHSLGGYLATSFARIFGEKWPVESINTFNSAGFSRVAAFNVENGFNQIAGLLGVSIGLDGFNETQNNYFALNGINVTTNTWNPVGFRQYGLRTALFQEDSVGVNNHSMYKLTDMLALGNALEKLDPNLNFAQLSALVGAGNQKMDASYEGILDALRAIILGKGIAPTLTGDGNANNAGPQPAARRNYQTNLAELQENAVFNSLQGKVRIELSSTALATQAPTDFGALVSLVTLSPLSITGLDGTLETTLSGSWPDVYAQWQADRALSPEDRAAGMENFSAKYLEARASMLSWVVNRNETDNTDAVISSGNDQLYRDYGGLSTTQIRTGSAWVGDEDRARFLFGGDLGDELNGGSQSDALFGGAGNDTLRGGEGNDYLEGNAGNDLLVGAEGTDKLYGGAGQDTLEGGEGSDDLFGGADADTLHGDEGEDNLNGGSGNDRLDGGTGLDILMGGAGDDELNGGKFDRKRDELIGGSGFDTYVIDGRRSGMDRILDSDGVGQIRIDGEVLTGGKRPHAGSKIWESADQHFGYWIADTAEGPTLVVRGRGGRSDALVRGFVNGQLGIQLTDGGDQEEKKPDPDLPIPDGTDDSTREGQRFVPRMDPLVLDLDGDGLEVQGLNLAAPIVFDSDADGIANPMGWVQPDDGFLVLDRNGNGKIDDGRELFGDATPLNGNGTLDASGGIAANGFAALAKEDTNGDGKVDAADARFNQLRIWQDTNQDGVSQAAELKTLQASGVQSIGVSAVNLNQTLPGGNVLLQAGSYTRSNGSTATAGTVQEIGEFNFVEDTFRRHFTDSANEYEFQLRRVA